MVTVTQAEVVDSMEPIIPLAPIPSRRPSPADRADTDQARGVPHRDREMDQGDEAGNGLGFLAHLGAPSQLDSPKQDAAETVTILAKVAVGAAAIAERVLPAGDRGGFPVAELNRSGDPVRDPPVSAEILLAGSPGLSLLASPQAPALPAAGLPAPGSTIPAPGTATPVEPTKPSDLPDPSGGQGDRAAGAVGGAGRATARTTETAAPAPRTDLAFALRYPSAAPEADAATLPNPAQAAPAATFRPAAKVNTGNPKGSEALSPGQLAGLPAIDAAARPAAAAPPEAMPSPPADVTPPQSPGIRVSQAPSAPVGGPTPAAVDEGPETPARSAAVADATPAQAAAPQAATNRDDRAIVPDAVPAKGSTVDHVLTDDRRPADFATGADGLPAAPGEPARDTPGQARTAAFGDRGSGAPALPAGLGQHLAEVAARFPDRPVELTLSPEELGRVRMTFTTSDGALTMTLVADRPDTLDLLRRHIDVLAQDFRDLGFANLSFSFAQGGESPPPHTVAIADNGASAEAAPTPATTPHRSAGSSDGGLDLRL